MASPSTRGHAHRKSNEMDPYSAAHIYYGNDAQAMKNHSRVRTYSSNVSAMPSKDVDFDFRVPRRRASHDEVVVPNRKFLVHVNSTLESLQKQEDTDNNMQITIEDDGPKVISLRTARSMGHNRVDIRGTYMLSNLLQELYLAKEHGRTQVVLDEARLNENPVDRLSRLIKDSFWDALTRRIDKNAIDVAGRDPKDWTDDPRPRIYVPIGCPEQYQYYKRVQEENPALRLDVQLLPSEITADFVVKLNDKPGLLAVAMEEMTDKDGKTDLRGVPFVVPGGRFNEFYGWDSYMESLGLLANNRVDLAKGMVKNFCFCIKHYGKILNATRSYYLCRSQPPFLTDMALRVYEKIKHEEGAKDFLREAFIAAIKEYHTVWMAEPRLDVNTGLSRYRPDGRGVPPETESSHFTHILEPYAKKNNVNLTDFVKGYNAGEIKEPELDEYFLHDRAVRESGHDTSYRLEKVCANLATIDLNSLLYKYETDIARTIRNVFNDKFEIPEDMAFGEISPNRIESSAVWDRRAKKRKAAIDKYLWNEEKGMYFDYDTVARQQCVYESCTTFWAMWAGVASPKQAASLVARALPKFEAHGGLLSGTEESRGAVGIDRPNRQWDYPYGWAPQQMLAWTGLSRYGYEDEAQRLAYKWLYMMTKAFVDFNGVVVEKYDVTRPIDPHRVDAEYGNQGLDFKGVAKEGFGWVNASYIYGLQLINAHMRRALGTLTPYEVFAKATTEIDI